MEFLGFRVSTEGIKPDSRKVQTIHDWPAPKTVKQVQSFRGFANFYRRFVPQYSKIAHPLIQLTKKDAPWEWTDVCETSFTTLKTAFTSDGCLAHFDPTLKTIVKTDASDYAMGAILSQVGHDGVLRPVAFESKSLSGAQLNYEIHDKEMLAIVFALLK